MQYHDILNKLLSSKKLLFASFACFGGILSGLITQILGFHGSGSEFLSWAGSGALDAALIGMMVVSAQNFYKTHNIKNFNGFKTALKVGLLGGFLGGIVSLLFMNLFGSGSFTRLIGWAISGGVAGYVISKQIPNLKKLHAIAAGALGAGLGCIFMYLSFGYTIGVAITGAAIGLMVALAEVIFRKSWIDVNIYSEPLGKGLNMGKLLLRYTLTLGEKPIKVGFGEDMDINLKPGNLTPASHLGSIYSEGENVFFQEIATNQKIVLNSAEKFRYQECEILLEAAPIR
jgi:hypothetical protein